MQRIPPTPLTYLIMTISNKEVLCSPTLVCLSVSKITKKLVEVFFGNLAGRWVKGREIIHLNLENDSDLIPNPGIF